MRMDGIVGCSVVAEGIEGGRKRRALLAVGGVGGELVNFRVDGGFENR